MVVNVRGQYANNIGYNISSTGPTTNGSTPVVIFNRQAFYNDAGYDASGVFTFDIAGYDFDNDESATAKIAVRVKKASAVLSIVGSPVHVVPFNAGSSAALINCAASFAIDGYNIKVSVIGVADRTIYWSCSVISSTSVLDNWSTEPTPANGYGLLWNSTTNRWEAGAAVTTTPASETFTSNDTWVCPSGITQIILEGFGGGGGGAGAEANFRTAGGGGGGAIRGYQILTVTPGYTYDITIGAGGVGGTAGTYAVNDSSSDGYDGGDTKFSYSGTDLVIFRGGGGGNRGTSSVGGGFGGLCSPSAAAGGFSGATDGATVNVPFTSLASGGSSNDYNRNAPGGYNLTGAYSPGSPGTGDNGAYGEPHGGGGGGAGPEGDGGDGGNGVASGANGEDGGSGGANTGAGGGGGGTTSGSPSYNGGAGGAGGSGKLIIRY